MITNKRATGNTLLTFPKTIYSLELNLADEHLTKICGRYDLLVVEPAYTTATVELDLKRLQV